MIITSRIVLAVVSTIACIACVGYAGVRIVIPVDTPTRILSAVGPKIMDRSACMARASRPASSCVVVRIDTLVPTVILRRAILPDWVIISVRSVIIIPSIYNNRPNRNGIVKRSRGQLSRRGKPSSPKASPADSSSSSWCSSAFTFCFPFFAISYGFCGISGRRGVVYNETSAWLRRTGYY